MNTTPWITPRLRRLIKTDDASFAEVTASLASASTDLDTEEMERLSALLATMEMMRATESSHLQRSIG